MLCGHPGSAPADRPRRLVQQLPRQVFDLNLARNQKEVNQGPHEENAPCQQPDQACDPPPQVEPVESQNSETAEKPEKIRDYCALHFNYLGERERGFPVESARRCYDLDLECRLRLRMSRFRPGYTPCRLECVRHCGTIQGRKNESPRIDLTWWETTS